MAFHHPRLVRWAALGVGDIRGASGAAYKTVCPTLPVARDVPLTSYMPWGFYGLSALLPGVGSHIWLSSCGYGEACHLGSNRGINHAEKEVLLVQEVRSWSLK